MKHLILIPPLLLITAWASYSQSTINAAGGQSAVGSTTHEWSIGEMTVVATGTNSSMSVTNGVLQPVKDNSTSVKKQISPVNVAIYPNPTSDRLQIEFKQSEMSATHLSLFDMQGRLVWEASPNIKAGNLSYSFSIAHLSQGTYMLKITANHQKTAVEGTFKIQKIN